MFPNAKADKLVMEEGRSRVYLEADSDIPKLNKALIKFLAAHFYVEKSMVSIISGADRREKLIQVRKS